MNRTNKKWSAEETFMILTYMHEKKEDGFEVEKPTADLYFTKMLTQISIAATLVQVKNRIKYLKASFSSALEWRSGTGAGVSAGTVEGYLLKTCPYFYEMQRIYGDKVCFALPFVRDTLEPKDTPSKHFQNNENVNESNLDENRVSAEEVANPIAVTTKKAVGRKRTVENKSVGNVVRNIATYSAVSRPLAINGSSGAISIGRKATKENEKEISLREKMTMFDHPDSDSEDDDCAVPENSKKRTKISTKSVARFKKNLSSPPKSKHGFESNDKPPGSNAASVMSVVMHEKSMALKEKNKIEEKKAEEEANQKRQEMMLNMESLKDKNKIEAMRAEEEASLRKAELKLNIDKFEYEKEMQKELQLKEMKLKEAEMELKKARIESKERLKILEMEKEERLAVMKMKLEESKLRPHE